MILAVQVLAPTVPILHNFLHQSLLLCLPFLLLLFLFNPPLLGLLLPQAQFLAILCLCLPQFLHLSLNFLRSLFLWLFNFSLCFLLFRFFLLFLLLLLGGRLLITFPC